MRTSRCCSIENQVRQVEEALSGAPGDLWVVGWKPVDLIGLQSFRAIDVLMSVYGWTVSGKRFESLFHLRFRTYGNREILQC